MKVKTLLCLLVFTLVSGGALWAQNLKSIVGVIHDEAGEPVIGASVLIVGGTRGTTSNAMGEFALNDVPADAMVEISFLGMTTQRVKAAPKMNVVMAYASDQLEEIIVTAFGTAKKSAFTGSATVLGSESIERKQVTNVMQSLVGEVPGLRVAPSTSPTATQSIVIRGAGSINAGTDPLIIVDGIPYEGAWNSINPQDVENVTVLKDAASSALYGARGANGVILITTKKGTVGKTKITVDAKWGVNSRASRDYDRITDPGQYYEMYYSALYNSYIAGGATPAEAYQKANKNLTGPGEVGGLGYNVYSVPNGQYLIGTNGRLNPEATLGNRVYRNGEFYTLMPDNWTDETYQTGFRQEYNVSVAGGGSDASIYGSLGYLSNEGIISSSDYERMTGRLQASYKAKKWLQVGGNFTYAHSTSNYAYDLNNNGSATYTTGGVFSDAANMGPIYPLYVRDGNGNLVYDKNGVVYDWGNAKYNPYQRPALINANSLNSNKLDTYQTITNNIIANGFADINLPKGFKISIKGGANVHERRVKAAVNPYYGYGLASNGSLSVYHYRTTTYNFQQLLTWNRTFGKHNIDAMIGHENYKYIYDVLSASKQGAVDFEGNTELDGYLKYPSAPGSSMSNYNTEGYMFRAMYDYDSRFYAQVSYRRDASSRFHPDNRWGNFWSLGGAWMISGERWFKSKWVDMLKVKASYGEVGNDAIGAYRYVDTYNVGNVGGELSLSFKNKGNKDITWETVSNFNAGVEFEFFQHRLNGNVEFYNKKTTDMLLWFTTPTALGYSGYYKNIGDMRNVGIEVTLNTTPVRTKNFTWIFGLNFDYNDQKVTYLPEENQTSHVDGYDGYTSGDSYIGVGLPLYTHYIAVNGPLSADGRLQWYDKNGELTTSYSNAMMHVVTGGYQHMRGGFNTAFSFYGVDISAHFAFGLGGKTFDAEYAQLMACPTGSAVGTALHKDILKAWSPENPDSKIHRFCYGDEYTSFISTDNLISSSYLSFQNFQVGYTLPKSVTRHLGIDRVRVYVAGENLYLWSHRKGFDPRLSNGYGAYSPMRTISGGINVQF